MKEKPFTAESIADFLKNDTLVPVALCIGTDRVIGDALGPVVGELLVSAFNAPFFVYGTLASPVTALNLGCETASVAGTSVAGILGAGVSAESGVPETFGLGAEEPPMSTMLPLPLPDGPHAVRKTVAANSRVPIIFFKYFIIINAEAKIPLSLLAENGRHDSGNKRPDKMLHDFRYRHNIMLLRRIQYLFVNIL